LVANRRGIRVLLAAWLIAMFASSALAADDQAVNRGLMVYENNCAGCHSVAANRIGPLHAGIVGRRAGSVKDFSYSAALKKSELVWSRDLLVKWLTDPEQVIPGQAMGFRLGNMQDRMDVVAYLATLKAAPLK
jgi:cytochrome c